MTVKKNNANGKTKATQNMTNEYMAYWCRLVFCIINTQINVEVMAMGSIVITIPVTKRFEQRHHWQHRFVDCVPDRIVGYSPDKSVLAAVHELLVICDADEGGGCTW